MIVLRKDVISTDMISATSISTATQLADINSDPLRCTPSIAENLLLWDPAKVLDPGCHGGEGFTTLIVRRAPDLKVSDCQYDVPRPIGCSISSLFG